MKLRLMTYNVHRCVGTDRDLDVERVAEVIADCQPDIVALQELDVGRARTRGVDQAHRLAELLGMR
ncbi:MAG TPA: endonuclease/exonuclease/phosphatase family protein, partial [Caulobacteraceae bacterium]|nr:endonuclease/exonuclease/phosphatase family protein [Caulobacteraceae bacterium]